MRLNQRIGRPRYHSGFTLIEMVVLMTATSAMLALLTAWIYQSLKQAKHYRNVQRDQITLTRLSDDVRRTIWRSKSASVTSPKLMDFVMVDGNEVRYQMEGQSIQRIERDIKREPVRTERFRFSNRHRILWTQASLQDKAVDQVTLQVNRLPANDIAQPSSPSNPDSADGIIALYQTAGVGRWAFPTDPAKESPQ